MVVWWCLARNAVVHGTEEVLVSGGLVWGHVLSCGLAKNSEKN